MNPTEAGESGAQSESSFRKAQDGQVAWRIHREANLSGCPLKAAQQAISGAKKEQGRMTGVNVTPDLLAAAYR